MLHSPLYSFTLSALPQSSLLVGGFSSSPGLQCEPYGTSLHLYHLFYLILYAMSALVNDATCQRVPSTLLYLQFPRL